MRLARDIQQHYDVGTITSARLRMMFESGYNMKNSYEGAAVFGHPRNTDEAARGGIHRFTSCQIKASDRRVPSGSLACLISRLSRLFVHRVDR